MLEVQKFLIENHRQSEPGWNFQLLQSAYGIKANYHPTLPLAILNYSQIDSPKMEKIVRECRGCVIDTSNYNMVAGCMERFFNLGEAEEITGKFVWDSSVESRVKEDGSLMTLFYFDDKWMVKTRASWADQPIGENMPRWDDLFFSLLPESFYTHASKGYTYIFEMCSRYNQVVRLYYEPKLFFLTMKFKQYGTESNFHLVDRFAEVVGLERPEVIEVFNQVAVKDYIQNLEQYDGTAEGLVLRDKNGLRIKVKSSTYLAFSQLGGNGNIASSKCLIPLILANEQDEAIAIFPYIKEKVQELETKLLSLKNEMLFYYTSTKNIESQKDFALAIKDFPLSSLLFKNRRNGGGVKELSQLFRESKDLLIKILGD